MENFERDKQTTKKAIEVKKAIDYFSNNFRDNEKGYQDISENYTSNVLCLGTRGDTRNWIEITKYKGLFFNKRYCYEPRPSLDKLIKFFSQSDNWLYFAGHFNYELERFSNEDTSISFFFNENYIMIQSKYMDTYFISKGKDFQQHQKRDKVIFWGGCHTCAKEDFIIKMFSLFGPHLMIGWKDTTNRIIMDYIFTSFYNKIKKIEIVENAPGIIYAWLNAVIDVAKMRKKYKYYIEKCSVIDKNGWEWTIQKDKKNYNIVIDRKIGISKN